MANAEYHLDIDHLMYVEHELPMEFYTYLEPLKNDLADLIQLHVDVAVREAETRLRMKVTNDLRDHIMVKDHHDW